MIRSRPLLVYRPSASLKDLFFSGFPEITAFTLERMTKRGTPPQKNVEKMGDTAFRRPRGCRCTCGRWHQSNGPAGCMRFHGRYTILHVFTITVSEHPNTQRPVAQALSSPKSQTYVRVTYLICAPPERVFHLRRAS